MRQLVIALKFDYEDIWTTKLEGCSKIGKSGW